MKDWLFDTTEAITGKRVRYSGDGGQFASETNAVIRESIQKQPWATIPYFPNEKRFVENFIQRYHVFISRHCTYEWSTSQVSNIEYVRNFFAHQKKIIFLLRPSNLKNEETLIDEFKRHSEPGDVLVMFRKL